MKIEIKTDKAGAVIYENVVEKDANSPWALQQLIDDGFNGRKVAATAMNAESSRSHLIVIVSIVSVNKSNGSKTQGKLLLCDLAGSERLAKSEATGNTAKEAIEINKSLTALGDVIQSLTQKSGFIPYRNHRLTQLMQDSLGGTAKTLMFMNCSPASFNTDETLMSLKYAQRAKQITNKVIKKKKDGEGDGQ